MIPTNIVQGFKGTSIWPLNPAAVADKMGPSKQFANQSILVPNYIEEELQNAYEEDMLDSKSDCSDDVVEDLGQLDRASGALGSGAGRHAAVAEVQAGSGGSHWVQYALPQAQSEIPVASPQQYYMEEAHCMPVGGGNFSDEAEGCGWNAQADRNVGLPSSLSHLLQLPKIVVTPTRRSKTKPLVDYTKSIIMTGDDYIKAMEEKSAQKESFVKEKELRKREAEFSKGKRAEEKIQKEAAKLQRLADADARRAFAKKWSAKAVARVGKELHQLIKSGAPPPLGAYVDKFLTFCPEICRNNQAIVKERMRARREGRTPHPALTTIPPPWVHQPNTSFLMELQGDCNSEVA
jgi:hypothetical protein